MQSRAGRALVAGYFIVCGLLVYSTIKAFHLERELAVREATVYKDHIRREEAVAVLRDVLWLGANQARQYLVHRDRQLYRRQIKDLERRADAVVSVLSPDVSRDFHNYSSALLEIADLSPPPGEWSLTQVSNRLVPRRMRILKALDGASAANQRLLSRAESASRERQRGAVSELFIVLGACLIAACGVVWVTLRYAARLQRERMAYFSEVAHLSGKLLDVQEEERRFLSRELHDEVGQSLTALRMELSPLNRSIQDPPMRARVQRAQSLAERTLQTVRNISLMLRPPLLDDLGLEPTLEWHLRQFRLRSGIEACLTADEGLEDLPDEVRTCAYRVAQEVLNNCEKYSGATRVDVTLRRGEDRLVLEIRDDGTGFDPKKILPLGGVGLVGIRERVSRVGGKMLLDSLPGQGTRIVVALPVGVSTPEHEVVNA